MKKLSITFLVFVLVNSGLYGQSEIHPKVKVEHLKPIEISIEKKNEYTGQYQIEGESDLFIEITLIQEEQDEQKISIILPSRDESNDGYTTTTQYTLIPQYEDKFYLKHDAFIKVHFTRSKKTGNIISLLFNANRIEEVESIRAKRIQ